MRKNDIFEAEIVGYSSDGSGVCRINGRAVFVPRTIVGEVWQVKILKVTSSAVWGKAIEPVRLSPERRTPDCEYCVRCGGCTLRHMSYDEELRFKLGRLNDALTHIGRQTVQAEEIIGSEGTLGVICELTLRLIDKPKADAILLLPFMDTESCVKAAQTVLGTGCSPAVVEYMDTDMVEFSGNVTGNPVFPVEMDGERVAATLMAVLEGEDDDLVMEQMESIAELAEELECLDILVGDTTTMKRDMWAAHDAFHTSMESGAKNSFEYNITVPAVNIAEMVEWVKAAAEEKGMKAMAYAHVGSGGMHIHIAFDGERDEFKSLINELTPAVYEKCTALGGDIRGEYGFGYAKAPFAGEAGSKLKAAKAELDPKGILNPGKVAD